MSDLVLAKSSIDQKVITLAQKIKAAQAPEVAQMMGWLAGSGSMDPTIGRDEEQQR